MKKSSIIGLIFVISVFIFIALYTTIQYQNRLNEYRRPVKIKLYFIHENLVKYYESKKQLPDVLEDLYKEKCATTDYLHERLEVPVTDKFGFFSNGKKYYLPFLYDVKLRNTYKNSSPDTIIVAFPRPIKGERYVLLLKDIVDFKSARYKTSSNLVNIMDEDKFQQQAKIQNWDIK